MEYSWYFQFAHKIPCQVRLLRSSPGGGALKYIGAHMREQKKKQEWKEVFFAAERVNQEKRLEVQNAMFQEKGGGFVKIYSNS